ncbi:unnamed protein product, partial [Amoebophrya sp. A25]|eukprot:GSA25T00014267001.1
MKSYYQPLSKRVRGNFTSLGTGRGSGRISSSTDAKGGIKGGTAKRVSSRRANGSGSTVDPYRTKKSPRQVPDRGQQTNMRAEAREALTRAQQGRRRSSAKRPSLPRSTMGSQHCCPPMTPADEDQEDGQAQETSKSLVVRTTGSGSGKPLRVSVSKRKGNPAASGTTARAGCETSTMRQQSAGGASGAAQATEPRSASPSNGGGQTEALKLWQRQHTTGSNRGLNDIPAQAAPRLQPAAQVQSAAPAQDDGVDSYAARYSWRKARLREQQEEEKRTRERMDLLKAQQYSKHAKTNEQERDENDIVAAVGTEALMQSIDCVLDDYVEGQASEEGDASPVHGTEREDADAFEKMQKGPRVVEVIEDHGGDIRRAADAASKDSAVLLEDAEDEKSISQEHEQPDPVFETSPAVDRLILVKGPPGGRRSKRTSSRRSSRSPYKQLNSLLAAQENE